MELSQLLLFGGIIIMALINAASLIWAFYLENKLRQKPVPKNYDVHLEGNKVFSEIKIDDIAEQAHQQLQEAVAKAMADIQRNIDEAVAQTTPKVTGLVEEKLVGEFEKYQVDLQNLRNQTMDDFQKLQQSVESRRQDLTSQLDKKIVEEYKRRMQQFDTKLNDVVSSYLVESLGNNVDLGTQTTYILRVLDQHKEDIKRDMLA